MELAAFVSRVKISTLVNGMNSVCIQGDGMKDQIEWTVFECKLKKKTLSDWMEYTVNDCIQRENIKDTASVF